MNGGMAAWKATLRELQQAVGVGGVDIGVSAHGFDHFGNAAALGGVVAAGDDVVDAGEIDGELAGLRAEVDGVEVELLEIAAGWARDVGAALAEGFKSAVETLGKIRDRAAEVAEGPLNAREAFGDSAEDEFGGGEGGVHQESNQRHQPEIGHGLDAAKLVFSGIPERFPR